MAKGKLTKTDNIMANGKLTKDRQYHAMPFSAIFQLYHGDQF
jgi:hypothetical protein